MRDVRFLVCGLLVCGFALNVRSQSRSVAITVDDLVCADCAPADADATVKLAALESTNARLVAGLARAHVPVTGFVITKTLDEAGDPGRRSIEGWLAAGFDLGNHSYSHPNFAEISTEQMEVDIARADATLGPLLAKSHRKLEFFRFPYNDTGDTQTKHSAMAAYLKEHGYEVATCTIDTSDYVFAKAYARAVGLKDSAMADRIRREYLSYSATEIDFYAALNRRVLRYEPPEVMLIHDSLLNADSIDELIALFRTRGYGFVSLAEAQSDAAYAIPDTYVTGFGPMWGYRWAVEKKLGRLGMNESEPAVWVTEYGEGKAASETANPNSR